MPSADGSGGDYRDDATTATTTLHAAIRLMWAVSGMVLAAVPRDGPFVLDLDGERWLGRMLQTRPMVEAYAADETLWRIGLNVETMLPHWMPGGDGPVFTAPP
jgi:hypothetical protein